MGLSERLIDSYRNLRRLRLAAVTWLKEPAH